MKIISTSPRCSAPRKSIFRNVDEGFGSATQCSGKCASPRKIPNTAVPRIPSRIAPFTRRTISASVSKIPTQATCTEGSAKFPRLTNVAGFATTSFALRNPTNAMNIPIPPAVACFNPSGIPFTICSRTRVTVSSTNSTPEKNTAPSAVGHGTCIPMQTV